MSMHWTSLQLFGLEPPLLSKHTTSMIGHRVYAIGGQYMQYDEATDAMVEVFNELMVFDMDTCHWFRPETTGKKPGALRAHTASVVDKRIFVFGGGDGPDYFNDLYVLDTVTLDWSKPTCSGTVPTPRRAHTESTVGSKIYIFGGGDGNSALNETYLLDTEKLSWTKLSCKGAVPDPRGYHTSAAVGDKVVIFGGSDTQECFSDVVVLDTQTLTFTKKKLASAKCRYSHTMTAVGNSWLFIFGGCDGTEYVDELNILNIHTLEWLNVSVNGKKPAPRGYHSALFYDCRLWVFGGSAGEGVFEDVAVLDLGVFGYLPLPQCSQVAQ